MCLYNECVSVQTGQIRLNMETGSGLLWISYFYVTFFTMSVN